MLHNRLNRGKLKARVGIEPRTLWLQSYPTAQTTAPLRRTVIRLYCSIYKFTLCYMVPIYSASSKLGDLCFWCDYVVRESY